MIKKGREVIGLYTQNTLCGGDIEKWGKDYLVQ